MKRLLITFAALVAFTGVGLAQASAPAAPVKKGQPKRTICHRTAAATNPYVRITVTARAMRAHLRHAGDIIPAPARCPGTVLTAKRGGVKLATTLTGAAEVPGPGDPDGSGSATIRLRVGKAQVCFTITVSYITLPAQAAHIHEAAAGQSGPVVVPLFVTPDADGTASGCVSASRALVKEILKNPEDYYVNVHTSDFPAGAVRGQLG